MTVEQLNEFGQHFCMIYVLAYPKFSSKVLGAISDFRRIHEPARAELVAPHITLVFGVKHTSETEILHHCQRVASAERPIEVVFDRVKISYDPFEKKHKMFLMVGSGSSEVSGLHSRLYSGPHKAEYDETQKYTPHMTVATNPERSVLEAVDWPADAVLPIKARIEEIDVVKLENRRLDPVETLRLIGS